MSRPTPPASPPTCRAASACSTPRCCSAWSPTSSAPHIVGAIVVFRLYYYIIPLFLAGFLFAGNEILLRGGGLLRRVERWPRCRRSARWSEPDFAVASATGAGRAVRRDAAVRRRAGAAARLLLDRSGLRRDRQSGRPVRPVADRRRADRAGDRPVAAGQPGLGRDDLPAGGRRRVHRDAGRAAVDRRRAGAGRHAGGAVPRAASTATPAC